MKSDALTHQPAWLDASRPREGRYVVGPLLGQGGMGEVREAWDVVLCRTVALKVLKKMDTMSLIRFMHEAQIHGRLVHPNICRIFDVDSTEDAPRIAMQLVRGPTFADAAPDLSLEEVIVILAQVSEAVHAAHRLKLIHRDLKPSNILLERNPEGRWVPYVCDFGLAMAMDEPALTYTQGIHGTPAYMAPEQLRGERRLVGPATDVYALGGTLLFGVYGEIPRGCSLTDDEILGRKGRPRPLPAGPRAGVPKALETIIQKCLEPDPAMRYPTAAALAEDLWRLRNGEPILAHPQGPLARRLMRLMRYRKVALTAGPFLTAALIGLSVFLVRQSRMSQQRADWTSLFLMEAANLEQEVRMERMLPIHDLRPAYAHLRQHVDAVRERMKGLDKDSEAPGRFALGRGLFLLGDLEGAQRPLDQAWAEGIRGTEVLGLKARILLGLHQRAEEESRFRTGLPAADPDSLVRQLDALFQQGRGPSADSEEGASALLAFARRDFTSAAAYARTSLLAKSWESETAALEVLSLYELGRRTYGAGDPQGAKQQFREALQAALRYLAVGQSDEALRHGYFLAARGLAQVQVDRGEVSPEFLAEYQKECDKALTLNPDHPGLQEDWLAFAFLKAVREADLGRDPAPGLEQALVFLATRAREPLPVQLLAQRMLIHWRLAERSLQEGGDPFPHLAEALKGSGHTGFLPQDYLLKVLNCQARAQASRNQDPRPALREILDRFQPILEKEPTWFLKEGLAETWLIRAEWEAARHLDPSASLREARGLAESALQANVASASAYALMGLAWVQEMRWNPARRSLLLLLARDRLRLSAAVSPSGRLQARLRKALGSR